MGCSHPILLSSILVLLLTSHLLSEANFTVWLSNPDFVSIFFADLNVLVLLYHLIYYWSYFLAIFFGILLKSPPPFLLARELKINKEKKHFHLSCREATSTDLEILEWLLIYMEPDAPLSTIFLSSCSFGHSGLLLCSKSSRYSSKWLLLTWTL